MSHYFTKETDKFIVEFIQSTDSVRKHAIFTNDIRPAFEKLIESLIFVYGFYTIDDVDTLKDDCLANLYEMIPKFKPERGAKGFSYFNVIAKNWFIQKTRERSRKMRLESELYCELDREVAKNDPNFTISPYEDQIEEKEFWVKFHAQMDVWREKFLKQSERKVLDAIMVLMQNPDCVTIYNKKAVYLYLRDLTGLNTKQVVVNLKRIRELYLKWKEKFLSDGENEN